MEKSQGKLICGAIRSFFGEDFSMIVVARLEQDIAWTCSLVNYFEQKAGMVKVIMHEPHQKSSTSSTATPHVT